MKPFRPSGAHQCSACSSKFTVTRTRHWSTRPHLPTHTYTHTMQKLQTASIVKPFRPSGAHQCSACSSKFTVTRTRRWSTRPHLPTHTLHAHNAITADGFNSEAVSPFWGSSVQCLLKQIHSHTHSPLEHPPTPTHPHIHAHNAITADGFNSEAVSPFWGSSVQCLLKQIHINK